MRRAEMMLATPLMLTVRHSHPALAALERQDPAIAAANRAQADRAVKFFDRRLAEAPYMAGDRVTIADIVAFIGLDFARMAQYAASDALTSFARWADAMRSRPRRGRLLDRGSRSKP